MTNRKSSNSGQLLTHVICLYKLGLKNADVKVRKKMISKYKLLPIRI